jgi:polar amino acid transport system substrate-binding protein
VGVGQIQGISSFTGGDGSFKRVLREGITLGIGDDYPFTYLDPKTKQYAGIDVEIFKRVTQMLGIQKVTWEIAEGGQQIPGLIAKRWDVDADNIHENPQRLAVTNRGGRNETALSSALVFRADSGRMRSNPWSKPLSSL